MISRLGGAAAVLAIGLAVVPASPRAQEWRAPFVASFDVVWETVRDAHYDPSLGGLDWSKVRSELRPRVESAEDPAGARAVMREMLDRLRQSHFTVMTAAGESDGPRGSATVLADVRVVPEGAVVTRVAPRSAAAQSGVRAGDRLLAIDGEPVLVESHAVGGLPPVLQAFEDWRRIARSLSGQPGSIVRLRVRRADGTDHTVETPREPEPGEAVTLGNLPTLMAQLEVEELRSPSGKRVGVIAFNAWMAALAEPFAAAIDRFRGADGLVVDLSGNPGGLVDMMRGIAGHLVDEPLLIGRMQMREAMLEFRANPRRSTTDGRRVRPYSGPVAIVVDGLTASASECFAAGLQSLGRARVFGTPTMGQALPALTKSLPSGDVLMYVVGDFVTSTGRRLEGTGVTPDEVVPLDPLELAAGRDARWRAIRWIDGQPAR